MCGWEEQGWEHKARNTHLNTKWRHTKDSDPHHRLKVEIPKSFFTTVPFAFKNLENKTAAICFEKRSQTNTTQNVWQETSEIQNQTRPQVPQESARSMRRNRTEIECAKQTTLEQRVRVDVHNM